MSLWTDFLDWLEGVPTGVAEVSNETATDVATRYYLPPAKPGSLIDYGTAHFIDPNTLPVSPFFDLATAPDYTRAGIAQVTGTAGQGGSSILQTLYDTFQASLADWADIFNVPLPGIPTGPYPTYHTPTLPNAPASGGVATSPDAPVSGAGPVVDVPTSAPVVTPTSPTDYGPGGYDYGDFSGGSEGGFASGGAGYIFG